MPKLAALITLSPAVWLFFLVASSLVDDISGYSRFIAPGPGAWPSWHNICQVYDGRVGSSIYPGYQGKSTPCICDPMQCLSNSTVNEMYQLRFARDVLLAESGLM